MNFTNLNDSEALITLSSQQSKDLFFCFAQTFRIPHTVRVHTSIIIKEEVVISIFWKKKCEKCFWLWPQTYLSIMSNLKRRSAETNDLWKRFSMMWAQFHESKLQCYGSTYQIPYIIIAGLLCDVRKSNLWFLLSKYLLLSRWQAMNFNYRTRAILTRELYTFYPLFEVQKRFFKGLFFLKLCPYAWLVFMSGF